MGLEKPACSYINNARASEQTCNEEISAHEGTPGGTHQCRARDWGNRYTKGLEKALHQLLFSRQLLKRRVYHQANRHQTNRYMRSLTNLQPTDICSSLRYPCPKQTCIKLIDRWGWKSPHAAISTMHVPLSQPELTYKDIWRNRQRNSKSHKQKK